MQAAILSRAYMESVSAEVKQRHQHRVDQRVLANLCLTQEEDEQTGKLVDCNCAAWARGVCQKHGQQFYRDLEDQKPHNRLLFEQKAIENGQILPAHGARKIKNRVKSPFARG